jgi:Tfp pilus assembly protein PilX
MKTIVHHSSEHQRGAALVIAIFAILLVTVIAIALLASGLLSRTIASNARESTEAYYIAEAGLSHANNLVLNAGASNFTSLLQSGDGVANTGDELSTRDSWLSPIPATGLPFGGGTYIVRVSDDPLDADGNPNADSNQRVVITSTGILPSGATATTESIIGVSLSPAILINGPARVGGNMQILGTEGVFHANGQIDVSGNSICASQYYSSSSTINAATTRTGASCNGVGPTNPNQPVFAVPVWNIRTDFYGRSDFVLGATGSSAGKVFDRSGILVFDAAVSGDTWVINASASWNWNASNRLWSHSGSSLPTGTYYSEGNIELGSNFGTAAVPARATIIAEGYIRASGNPYMRPNLDNFSLMAGTDLRLSGNPTSGSYNYQGIHYAGHQLGFLGNPGISGSVIAANIADTDSPGCGCNPIQLNNAGYMDVSGNPTITYNGGLLNAASRIISWREVRY